jgi:PAS domain S-box-containing protein
MVEHTPDASDQWFHAIYDSVSDAIFIHDFQNGAILDVNQRMCELYGYTRAEVLQLTIGDLSAEESPYTLQDAITWIQTIPPGGTRMSEWRARGKNGRLFWVEINARRTEIEGQERLVVIARDIDSRKKADQIRSALYLISDATRTALEPDDFYTILHTIIRTLMPARNFYIALYNTTTQLLSYPYYSDEYDQTPSPHPLDKGLTTYVLHTGLPLLATAEIFEQLVRDGVVETIGAPSVDWLGVPLKSVQAVIGILAVQTYTDAERLTVEDKDVLIFIANQVAMILERKQAEEHDRKLTLGLRAVIEAADELIRCEPLDTVYRRTVELAREKLGLERCGLVLLDTSSEYLLGTYGTDEHGGTTDERAARISVSTHPEIFAPVEKLWTVHPWQYTYWDQEKLVDFGSGWIASTVVRDNAQPIGVLYNDTAISHAPLDDAVQETVAIFCSRLGNIIQRKRMEERERVMIKRLQAVVECADELIRCESLDILYRRAVELAREKLYVERCTIFLLDEQGEYLNGTYGTDDKGQTTDEHEARWLASNQPIMFTKGGQNRELRLNDLQSFWENGVRKIFEKGWIAFTLIRITDKPIGLLCNDAAITHAAYDESLQETVAIYCSLLGNIIERMHVEAEQKNLISELETKNTELERFTYTVSHDLKAPLITIRGFLGFVEKDAAAYNMERLRSDIARISEATNKMQRLLYDLLELSRIGRLMNPSQPMPFEDIAREAINLVRGQIEACGAEIILQEGLPIVFGDGTRLVEVAQNLLDNAVKFTNPQGNPRIEIGSRGIDEHGMPVLFVRDNGIGIETQYHDRIFGLFNKLNAQSEGTGVGLTVVKRIIELHGGRIWVESAGKDQGSTFYFTLPAGKPDALPGVIR